MATSLSLKVAARPVKPEARNSHLTMRSLRRSAPARYPERQATAIPQRETHIRKLRGRQHQTTGKRSTRPVKHQVNFVSFFKSAMKLCISV
jgi:hypothetical protein